MATKRVTMGMCRWGVQQIQKRGFIDTPNRIAEYRKPFVANPHLHGADNPTYLKKGKVDEYLCYAGAGLCGTALLLFGHGLYSMMLGINKLD
mmetsp:Transcript_19213/g.24931  ORF Transcript_19213/g.24931 Transcript_19213/m.24931 type:complete len:92 (-) Transcript_19213:306-581(-)